MRRGALASPASRRRDRRQASRTGSCFGGRGDRLDVYFDDGSFVTYVDGSPEADRLLPLARQVLAVARET